MAQAHLADPERWWDDLLTRSARAPAFRMVRDGATLPRTQLCRSAGVGHQRLDDLIEPNRVLEAYDEGASLVLQGLQHSDPAMARLSTNLALELDQPVQLNAYLSPAAARGLDLHFDYHDVIVVQLSGTKAWRIWAPLVRSLLPQKRGPGIAKPGWDEVGEPVIDVVVQPGDALVIPRGHPHAASTIDDESAHLTIGIMSLTWQALIGNRLRDTVGGSSLSATAAPTHPGHEGGWAAAMAALAENLDERSLLRAHRLEVWRRQPRTRLRPRRTAWDLERPLHVTPGPLLWLDEERSPTESTVALQLGDRAMTLPAAAGPLLAWVLRRGGVHRRVAHRRAGPWPGCRVGAGDTDRPVPGRSGGTWPPLAAPVRRWNVPRRSSPPHRAFGAGYSSRCAARGDTTLRSTPTWATSSTRHGWRQTRSAAYGR
ncbi:MAG: hypothetical protein IPF42_06255 [Candidatus Microthrix sp.]|nr:hypothetical protein [Candidatus Microthrix sp.]